jgi:hypothetical protein
VRRSAVEQRVPVMHRAAGAERLPVWADIVAMPLIPDEVSAREDAVRSIALLPDRHVRCDAFGGDQFPNTTPRDVCAHTRAKNR